MCDTNALSRTRTRLCVCYIITTLLIGTLIYVLVSNSIENNRKISRLRDEMDEITHMVLHNSIAENTGDHTQLAEYVDTMIRKRLSGVWDDVYNLKKQVKAAECAPFGLGRSQTAVSSLADNRINYAAEEIGARIEDVVAEPLCGSNFLKTVFGLEYAANPPVYMLRQSMTPSNCFAFKDQADVTVKLAREIYIDTVEVEHIAKKYASLTDSSSAPKDFEIYGVNNTACDCKLLGKFQYDDSSSQRIQHFPIDTRDKFHLVRFRFLTNAGNPNYTCVYRVGVYGNVK